MALKIPMKDETIKVISRLDSALSSDADVYEEYLKTLDESLLSFVDGETPTRFVMKKVLPLHLQQKIQDKQVAFVDGKPEIRLGFMSEDVRCSLVAVENPADIPDDQKIKFAKDSDGGASKDLVAHLLAAGVVNDLYQAKQYAVSGIGEALKKK